MNLKLLQEWKIFSYLDAFYLHTQLEKNINQLRYTKPQGKNVAAKTLFLHIKKITSPHIKSIMTLIYSELSL